jgi:hypothetical protein
VVGGVGVSIVEDRHVLEGIDGPPADREDQRVVRHLGALPSVDDLAARIDPLDGLLDPVRVPVIEDPPQPVTPCGREREGLLDGERPVDEVVARSDHRHVDLSPEQAPDTEQRLDGCDPAPADHDPERRRCHAMCERTCLRRCAHCGKPRSTKGPDPGWRGRGGERFSGHEL